MHPSCRILSRLTSVNRKFSSVLSISKPRSVLHPLVCGLNHRHSSRSFHSSAELKQFFGETPTEPEAPRYEALTIQVKGYDFPVLEKFARYVHRTAERIGLEVEDAWATPAQNFRVTQLKPESVLIESEYLLNLYERNVQIVDVPATILPVLVNIVEASMPAGVTMRVQPYIQEHTELRYVPDLELKELKQQLLEMTEKKNK